MVSDEPGLIALYLPFGAEWVRPVHAGTRTPLRMPEPFWELAVDSWPIEALRLIVPGERHSVLLLWSPGFGELLKWYINMEDPFQRTSFGFDYMDQVLDIEATPDLSSWSWKDEDELDVAARQGIMTPERATMFREEGERAIARLIARREPFNRPWEEWRPDPAWDAPALPEGWDDLARHPSPYGTG